MSKITTQSRNAVGIDHKSCHQLYTLSTLLDAHEERENLEELFKLVTEIKDSVLEEGDQQFVEKCFYSLHSKSMTIIDIFTHLLLEANQQNSRVSDQFKENEKSFQKEIHQLRNWHAEESEKAQGIRQDLIRSNEELGRNVEVLEDMLDKMKAEYDLVKNQLEQINQNFAQQIKQKQILSSELQQAIAYIEQNIHNSDQIVEEDSEYEEDGSSSIKSRERILRSLKASPISSNSRVKTSRVSEERSDNSTSNLLYMSSPFNSERAKETHKVHEEYEKYIEQKNNGSANSKKSFDQMLSPVSNVGEEKQKYYNPTLIVNSSQNSVDFRDRSSFESIQKPAILTEILNLNSSYQNTAHRLSSYQKYENVQPFTNERVSIEIVQGQIKSIQHFHDDEEDQYKNQNIEDAVKIQKKLMSRKSLLKTHEKCENTKLIRIQDQNNSIKANVEQERNNGETVKEKKRKGSAIIGQFTTGQSDEVTGKLKNIPNIGLTDPYWAFFTLSVQCAKINSGNLQKAASVDLSSLWDHIRQTKLPFHEWQTFISSILEQVLENEEAETSDTTAKSSFDDENKYFSKKPQIKFSAFLKKGHRDRKSKMMQREKQAI